MLFYKETLSYRLVSLLDELKIKRKYINIILFIIRFNKFKISKKILLKRNTMTYDEKIELFIELFKERFYLEQLIEANNIETESKVQYNLNNNILLSEISYKNNIRFNMEYTISDDKYSVYITAGDKCFNASKDNLKIKSILNAFEYSTHILFIDWQLLMDTLFLNYCREVI